MKLSIIVPVYRAEAYLPACVESVLAQDFADWELILVDDGSPDGSGDICEEYAARDRRIRVIHQENGGPTAARTAGAELAEGEYVLLLDSDDLLAPELLAELAHILRIHKPDAVLFDSVTFDTPQPVTYETALPEGLYEGAQLRESLILNDRHEEVITYGLSAKLLPTERYRELQRQVPQALYRGEDMAVSVPLLAGCQRVYVRHICGYRYRCTPGSIMNTFRQEEPEQLKLLTTYLLAVMGEAYRSRIAAFTVQHLFDWLDRAMLGRSYSDYLALAKGGVDAGFDSLLRIARSRSPRLREKLIFRLTAHRCFGALWLLRKLKPRK